MLTQRALTQSGEAASASSHSLMSAERGTGSAAQAWGPRSPLVWPLGLLGQRGANAEPPTWSRIQPLPPAGCVSLGRRLTSLCLSFVFCEMGMVAPRSLGFC